MRTVVASTTTLLAAVALVVACGGSTAPTIAPVATPTIGGGTAGTPVASSPATAGPSQAPGGGGGAGAVTVTLTGGANAGTYTGTADPHCTFGVIGGSWGLAYADPAAGTGQLSSVQMIDPVSASSDTTFSLSVTIGSLLSGNTYNAGGALGGTGSAQVTDNGTAGTIHATGTTSDGVGIDVVVNCATIVRP